MPIDPVASQGMPSFERMIDEFLVAKQRLPATIPCLPNPATYLFRRTKWRSTGCLAHVFDFAGEILSNISFDSRSELKKRLLQMDGIFLFLDPDSDTDRQVQTVQRFLTDLRAYHQIQPCNKLPIPIAICISKLDILPKIDATKAKTHNRFIQAVLDTGTSASSDAVLRRSELCRVYLHELIPALKEIDLFDDQKLHAAYFPISSIGFREIGERDLAKRTIEPFGVIEPLLWLVEQIC